MNQHDLSGERALELRSGSFQVVTNLQIFVTSGQTKNSRIEIDCINIYGAPVLAIQPLLAVDSMLKPPVVFPSDVPSNANNKANSNQPDSEDVCQNNCNQNQTELQSCCPSDKDNLGVPFTLPHSTLHREERHSHHQPRTVSVSNGNTEQLPGHSKNLIPDERINKEKHRHHHKSSSKHHHD